MKEKVKKLTKKTTKKLDGRIKEFSFYAPEATEVYVAGEFNNWDTKSHPMKKNKDGVWKKRTKLPYGRHEYKLIVDGVWVQDIPDTDRVPNPFGTMNSVIIVGR